MYNLLVKFKINGKEWTNGSLYHCKKDRFHWENLKFNDKSSSPDFKKIEQLKDCPTLFAYEGEDEPVRIGYIRFIRDYGDEIAIQYEIDENIPEFNFTVIKDLVIRLDIEPWEMNRTHWAVKNENLFETLALAGVVKSNRDNPLFEYPVALSFAGEDREYVDKVANLLRASGINPFYDKFEEDELWGKNLYDHLADIYENKAQYTVMFISKHYAEKQWTDHERGSAQARAFTEHKEYILPARFDDTKIPGIPSTIGYVKIGADGKSPDELCELIKKKLSKIENKTPDLSERQIVEFLHTLEKSELIFYLRNKQSNDAIKILSKVKKLSKIISTLDSAGLLKEMDF